jgi:hypothetical protein
MKEKFQDISKIHQTGAMIVMLLQGESVQIVDALIIVERRDR